MQVIGHIHTEFSEKFGIPRQSGLVKGLKGRITFLPEYRQIEAFRGLEAFSHIWILWEFSKAKNEHFHATVKPPRLGGNTRMGVFATRSPFRPNSIGLSSVKLEEIVIDEQDGPTLIVSGIDMLDGTPILDIKPYLTYTDCHPEATSGFGDLVKGHKLSVSFPEELLAKLPESERDNVNAILAEDPRPSYQDDSERIYGVAYGDFDIRFQVDGDTVYVKEVVGLKKDEQNHLSYKGG